MVVDVSIQHIIITLVLGVIIWIGNVYGDSSKKYAHLFFIGGMAGILLICYWMYYFLAWVAHIV